MTGPDPQTDPPGRATPAPPVPTLGPADDHRGAAEVAARRHDYDTALRERFRAVIRGLEQGGVLTVRRARTAHETAVDAVAALPEQTGELPGAAHSFDEVVYGGRSATEAEYRRLVRADIYSHAPPPPVDEVEIVAASRRRRARRRPRMPQLPPLPQLLRNPKFWAVVVAAIALALLVWVVWQLATASSGPPPQPMDRPPRPHESPSSPPEFGEGTDSIFAHLSDRLTYGGLQWLIFGAIVVWWRARRRGALVPEPQPVQVAANELLTGQAGLYRRSGDRDHVADTLRAASLRRIRPGLGLTADAPADRIAAAIGARTGLPDRTIGSALFAPVPDDETLRLVAAQLERIESEIG